MSSRELAGAVDTVRQINDNRGCPHTMPKASERSAMAVGDMTPDARKQEYYFALDEVLPEVVGVVRDFRRCFPGGLVVRNEEGGLVSGLSAMQERVRPYVQSGEFLAASYWVHDAVSRTLTIASEQWLAGTDRTSETFTRINQLVGDPYKEAFGDEAIQKAVASAANQTVFISSGFQQVFYNQYEAAEGVPLTSGTMSELHHNSVRLAMPLTNLHFTETGHIIALLEPEVLPDGSVSIYANNKYFTYADGLLHTTGSRLVDDLATQFPDPFPDGRIGCPGAKYIPEIWSWIGDLTNEYANPAFASASYDFNVPQALPPVAER